MQKGQRRRANRSNELGVKPLRVVPKGEEGSVLFVTDIHFPFQDDNAVERFLDHAESEQVDTVIVGGDAIDAYSVSKYDPDPKRIDSLQDELDQLGGFLAAINKRQPSARKVFIMGNHEDRIPRYMRRKAPALERLRSMSMSTLLQTEENGFELHNGEGILIDGTRYKHGVEVAQGSGNSVKKAMEKHWRNVFIGHCHRRAVRRVRKDDREFVGGEAGGLMDLSPSYVKFPDWQQGWFLNKHAGNGHDIEVGEFHP